MSFLLIALYTLLMWILLYIPGRNKWCNNSHTSSTHIVIYDIPHIFYTRIDPHPLSSDADWILLIYIYTYNWDIGPAVRVFANGPGDLGSIPGRVIPKTLKMVLDTTLLNTQHYKVRFKGKVEQSREWSSALPYTLV